MPKKLPADEERFVRCYIKEGGVEEKLPEAEKRARLKKGAGAQLLKKKRVADEVRVRMEPVRLEQMKQQMLADAVEQVTADLKAKADAAEKTLKEVLDVPLIPVMGNETRIDHELMRLVQLCPEKYGGIKLAAIKTAYVVAGLMEQGTTRRVIPAEGKGEVPGGGVYQNLFDRQRQLEAANTTNVGNVTNVTSPPPLPPAQDEVFDLTPVKVLAPEPVELRIPLPGESIEPVLPAAGKKTNSRVITVEVG